jgi:hypothetical protein
MYYKDRYSFTQEFLEISSTARFSSRSEHILLQKIWSRTLLQKIRNGLLWNDVKSFIYFSKWSKEYASDTSS